MIRSEEQYMLSRHGENFAAYMAKVPRFFPSWRLLVEKEAAMVHLVILRKHILNAIWFIWIPAFLECIEYLREAQIMPRTWPSTKAAR